MNPLQEIDQSYATHPGFKHPFWDWIARGEFDREQLRAFALLYYEHVKIFRLYLAGTMSIMPTEELQVTLAKIIADEYGIPLQGQDAQPSHPEMFRRFMHSLGLTEDAWSTSRSVSGIEHYRRIHFSLFRGGLIGEALGAVIFGMERTTPYRHGKVLEGLNTYCAKHDTTIDSTFFSAHVEIDEDHNESLIVAADEWISDEWKRGLLKLGARISFDAREIFLDDLSKQLAIS